MYGLYALPQADSIAWLRIGLTDTQFEADKQISELRTAHGYYATGYWRDRLDPFIIKPERVDIMI